MDEVNSVKNTFSSWDSCMSKAYCKWPVIVGIVIGSLVILSILFCIGRCICCGAECACCCFRCCAGCCGSGNSRRDGHKHLESVPSTPYGPGPGGPGLPLYNNSQYQRAPAPVYQHNAFAQTATFDGKVHEDSLPAMPSWETATSRQVEVVEDAKPPAESHELEKLNPAGQGASRAQSPAVLPGFSAPQPARTVGNGPTSPYGHETDPFLQGQQANGVTHADSHTGYRGASPNPAQAVGYGYANHRPGGLQNAQQSYNSQSTSDFYSQQSSHVGAGYSDQRGGAYGGQYGNDQHQHGYDNHHRQPSYEDDYQDQHQGYDRQYGNQQHGGGYQHHDAQYPPAPAYDNGHSGYGSYSSPYGGQQDRRAVNGSWKDV